jgi:hypothetical protein
MTDLSVIYCHHLILQPLKLLMALRSKYVDATYYVKILRSPRYNILRILVMSISDAHAWQVP